MLPNQVQSSWLFAVWHDWPLGITVYYTYIRTTYIYHVYIVPINIQQCSMMPCMCIYIIIYIYYIYVYVDTSSQGQDLLQSRISMDFPMSLISMNCYYCNVMFIFVHRFSSKRHGRAHYSIMWHVAWITLSGNVPNHLFWWCLGLNCDILETQDDLPMEDHGGILRPPTHISWITLTKKETCWSTFLET